MTTLRQGPKIPAVQDSAAAIRRPWTCSDLDEAQAVASDVPGECLHGLSAAESCTGCFAERQALAHLESLEPNNGFPCPNEVDFFDLGRDAQLIARFADEARVTTFSPPNRTDALARILLRLTSRTGYRAGTSVSPLLPPPPRGRAARRAKV